MLKKAGVCDVELMRTVQLMPAAFNVDNKKTGREVMARAEKPGLLPDEQSGSCKGRRAILAALNKVLTTNLSHQKRLVMALCSDNTKSCCDRTVLWIADLCLRPLGTSVEATLAMMITLQQAHHWVHTAFGTSTKKYGRVDPPCKALGKATEQGPPFGQSSVRSSCTQCGAWGLV